MTEQTEKKFFKINKNEMKSFKNSLLHGIYLLFYGFVKNLPFPFCNYLRYCILRLFAHDIKTVYISENVLIMFPWLVKIGKKSSLNYGTLIDGYGGVLIGEGVRIASYVQINSTDHEFSNPDEFIMNQGYICGRIVIEDDVWIGCHVTINKGVTIGRGSIIGSGSVVTKDIPPYSVAVGVPCHVIKKRK